VLLLADAVYQGTSEDGVWTFVLEDRSVSTQSETHDAGYTFVEEDEEVTTVTIRFERDGEDASGKIDARSEANESTSETDQWDPVDVGIVTGQLRANILDPDTGGGAVRNQADNADCQGTTCELTVVTTCASSSRFTAVRTNHDPSEYEYLADVGQ
ncbi:MAG: hypothetical protein H6735_33630, partial [Alphaproteobacteria bacterium]|nr:hypothetical protein [Alphaproteobacteria bacterium]